jgi:hypothetical protein
LQVFKPRADTLLRLAVLLAALTLIGIAAAGAGFAASTYASRTGWPQDQPVPFSHKHHVADDGLDCRFCHTSVEQGPRAGLPSTQVCMTCHSQIWTGAEVLAPVRQSFASGRPIHWMRVAQVPDFVFFNHSIHVKRGVACSECHGRIDTMPLTWRAKPFQMQWCLDCHRDPAPHLRPQEEITSMTWEPSALVTVAAAHPRTECTTCHR